VWVIKRGGSLFGAVHPKAGSLFHAVFQLTFSHQPCLLFRSLKPQNSRPRIPLVESRNKGHIMIRYLIAATILLLAASGCSTSNTVSFADANAALNLADTLEQAYAALPTANPAVVAKATELLAASQAALASWEASGSEGDQQGVNAAIAALVAYEASAGVRQ
jgi:hypothetical protein